jgi:hypothetical protein
MKRHVIFSIVVLVILALALSACGSIKIGKKATPTSAKTAATATVVTSSAGAATKAPAGATAAATATKAPAGATATATTKGTSGAATVVPTTASTKPAATGTVAPKGATAAPVTAVATKPVAAGSSTAVPTKAAAEPTIASATGADSPSILEKAQRALLSSTSLRIKTTMTSSQGKVSTSVVDYVAPGALHTIADGTELIVIKGAGAWQKDPNGKWIALPKTFDVSATAFAFLDPKQVDSLMKTVDAGKFKAAGTENIDGNPMKIYTYVTTTTSGDVVTTTTTKIWIGGMDGLPYKSESESQSSAAAGEKSKTLIIYEYDPSIRIQSPI